MADSDLIALQVAPSEIQPSVTKTATDLLLPPMSLSERMRHFPDTVYDISPESHLSVFLKVLIGDAGAGQLRKRILLQRMQSTLSGTHFFDLDRFYGALFGLRRSGEEVLLADPYAEPLTREEWEEIYAKDASFRSRIEQFAKALTYGPTPAGMELIAEALLTVDCDVYESYIQADGSFQTYQELEDQFGVNVLTDNQSSVETDNSDWVAGPDSGLGHGTDWYFPDGFSVAGGSNSLVVSGTTGVEMSTTTTVTTIASEETYTFAATVASTLVKNVHVEIEWRDNLDALISTAVGDPVAIPADDTPIAQQLPAAPFVIDQAPVNADSAILRIVSDNAAGNTIYCDRMEFGTLTYQDMKLS